MTPRRGENFPSAPGVHKILHACVRVLGFRVEGFGLWVLSFGLRWDAV